MKQKITLDECLLHIPQPLTPDIKEYAIEEVFKRHRYIFVTRDGKYRTGYCTYCHKRFDADKVRHNQKATCPCCQSECIGKLVGMGRKGMFDDAYFVFYMKSAIDPSVIVAVGTYAARDFYYDYWNVKTNYATTSLYVFQPGIGGTAFHRHAWYNRNEQSMYLGDTFNRAGSCKCQFNRGHNASIHATYSRESIAAAVAGTPFQYSTWEQYKQGDMTEFFDLAARYPCVEYLTKLGFRRLIEEKLNGDRTYGAINWNGKSMEKVLKVSRQELQAASKELHGAIGFDELWIMQEGKKDGSKLSLSEARDVLGALSHYLDEVLRHPEHGNIRTIYNYLLKQTKKGKYKTARDAFPAWRDYIKDCKELGYDLTKERTRFPTNLYKAHQKTIKLVKHKADEILNQKIKHRAEKIKHLCFEKDGLLIRPALSTEELITEGKVLDHCVGGYSKGYAEGKGDILFVRRIEEPDKPYFTVEVRGGFVAQCRGRKNCGLKDDVKSFMDAFKKERLQKPVKSNKKREVAV
ncbi:MAG: PcfJ domain-containing protein [Dethiobacter sp.]|nr:PcfJ domain-containing protein [Dethiobacter sp.]MBS3898689.1 PcfJ domain-containing protein [Dethiobacter sp.]